MVYDVAVIGAGVVGSLIARELSFLELSVCVLEAAADVAGGASRANSGIVHAGFDAKPGSKKAYFNVRGNAMMPRVAKELDVLYENCGSLVAAFGDSDEQSLELLCEQARQNDVPVRMLSGKEVREKEPCLSADITAALYAPTAGIVCPFGLTIAAVENAVENGATVLRSSPVKQIERKAQHFDITAGNRRIQARFVVNAAGVYADEISRMAGGEEFSISARRGEYVLFDRSMSPKVNSVVFGAPSDKGKGVLFSPTAHGNMIAGPTAEFTDKDDTTTTREGIAAVIKGASRYIPALDMRSAITVFSGLRAMSDGHDFIIEASQSVPGLVNVAGIESPGLTAAPAIAEYVRDMLIDLGLSAKCKPNIKHTRTRIESFADATDVRRRELIAMDERYANVVCRCEYVTEAEIVQSIQRPCGATTVDGVKLRTGAGFGRCHGGFCLPRVMAILARELGQSYEDVTKSGEGAWIIENMEESR